MSSSIAARILLRSRNGLHHSVRRIPTSHARRSLSAVTNQSSSSEGNNGLVAALVTAAAAAGVVWTLVNTRDDLTTECDTKASIASAFSIPSLSTAAQAEPRRFMTMQPRNVMLHRMRSNRARGLNDKYQVDWKIVLGEGAYGSVHPARLASTGEKVRRRRNKLAQKIPNNLQKESPSRETVDAS
jgi:hypothetical protein